MDTEFLKELFSGFGAVAPRKMFGGMGVFYRGLNFAVVVDDALFLRADIQNIPEFEAESMTSWNYTRKDGKVTVMPYWQVPERLLDDPDEFSQWASKAFDAAMRADTEKPASKRKLQEI